MSLLTLLKPEGIRLKSTGATLNVTIAAGTYNVPYPATMAVGDVLVLHMAIGGGSAFSGLASWDEIYNGTAVSGARGGIWVKQVDGSETGTEDVTLTTAQVGNASILCFSGVDAVNYLDVEPGAVVENTLVSLTADIPSLTTTIPGCMLVYGCCFNTSTGTFTAPGVEDKDYSVEAGGTSGKSGALYHEVVASSGATGTRTITGSLSRANWGAMVALRPATPAPPETITYRADSSATGTDASVVGTIPGGTQDGDLMVAFIALAASSSTVTTPPTGWTLQEADPNPADFSCLCYTRLKQAGDADPTWTISAAGGWSVDILSFDGVDQTTPVNVGIGEIVPAASAITLGPLTPTVDDAMLVGWAAIDATGTVRNWSQDGAMTEVVDQLDNAMHRSAAYELLSDGSGVAVSRTFTDISGGSVQDIGGFLLALKPAAGAGTTPKAGAETHTISDSIAVAVGTLLTETNTLSESASVASVVSQVGAETYTTSETFALSVGYSAVDASVLSDIATLAQARVAVDSWSTSEAIALSQLRTSVDSWALTEALTLSQLRAAADSGLLSDSAALGIAHTVIDSWVLNDISTLAVAHFGTDSWTLTDSTSIGATAGITDSWSLTDAAALAVAHSSADAWSTADTALLAVAHTAVDAGVFTDVSALQQARLAVDSWGFTDDRTTQAQLIISEALTWIEVAALANAVSAADSLTQTEATTALSLALNLTDISSLTDSASIAAAATRVDSSTFTDAAVTTQTNSVSGVDSGSVSDTAALLETLVLAASDALSVTETKSLELRFTVADSSVLAESLSISVTLTSMDSSTLSDAATLADTTQVVAADTFTFSEVSNLLIGLFLQASETHTLTEGTLSISVQAAAFDSATGIDSAEIAVAAAVNESLEFLDASTLSDVTQKAASDGWSVADGAVLSIALARSDTTTLAELGIVDPRIAKAAFDAFVQSAISSLGDTLTAPDIDLPTMAIIKIWAGLAVLTKISDRALVLKPVEAAVVTSNIKGMLLTDHMRDTAITIHKTGVQIG